MQLKFQQSRVCTGSSSTECWTFQLRTESVRTVKNYAEDRRLPGVVLGEDVECPLSCNDRCLGLDSAENCGGSAVAVGAVLGKLLTCPFVHNDKLVQTEQKNVLVPQVQIIDVGSSRCELQP